MSKATRDCPLCKGSGKVSAKIAEAKITVRDRARYNESMKNVNARARERKKALAII
jgi:hypothetical protein